MTWKGTSNVYHALTVVLDDDYLAEEIEILMMIIRQLKGVADVTMLETRMEDTVARIRLSSDVKTKLFAAIREAFEQAGY